MQFRSLGTKVSVAMGWALLQWVVCAPRYELEKMGDFSKNQTYFYENPTQTHRIAQGENVGFRRDKRALMHSVDVLLPLEDDRKAANLTTPAFYSVGIELE